MDRDLIQFKDVIECLKPVIKKPEFSQAFKQLTQDIPTEKRFLIKMELNRLVKPCLRSIDLRGQVDGECKLVEFEGKRHYLDAVAEEVFQAQTQLFGLYCFGVYEAVIATENNFRVMRRKAEQAERRKSHIVEQAIDSDPRIIPVVNMLSYANRTHERMNFAIAIEIKDNKGKSYQVTSVDISMVGLRLKIPKTLTFQAKQKLYVFFRGLENEYAMDKQNGVVYSVITTKTENDTQYLILNREVELSTPSFDKFLEQFIQGNRRRYKVNLGNTIEAIENKSTEQYVSTCSPSLPVFIDAKENLLLPRFTLVNSVSREVFDYWADEKGVSRLEFLLKPARLKTLNAEFNARAEMFVYCFVHIQKGAVYHYSAADFELVGRESLKNLFLGFGARRVSWRVFKLSISDASPEQAYAPLSIPDSIGSLAKNQNAPLSARLKAHLKNIRYTVNITDVTTENAQEQLAKLSFSRADIAQLKLFAHSRNSAQLTIKAYPYRFDEQRLQFKHLLRSELVLTDTETNEVFKGVANDLCSGLIRLELLSAFSGKLDTCVKVQFTSTSPLKAHIELEEMHYQVVQINAEQKILHLKAAEGITGKVARSFIERVGEYKQQEVNGLTTEEDIEGIAQALRCINARNTPNFAVLLAKAGAKFVPHCAILSEHDSAINELACYDSDEHNANINFVYNKGTDESLMHQNINEATSENQPSVTELYVSFEPGAKSKKLAILPRLFSSFPNDEYRKQFMVEALSRGQFIAIRIIVTPTPKPDMTMLSTELKYVGVYALHKAKKLEEQIWSIGASIHSIETTSEVLYRFGFDQETIAKNRLKPKGANSNLL